MMRFPIYRSGVLKREWRWRLSAKNSEVIASGGGCRHNTDCIAAVGLIQQQASSASASDGSRFFATMNRFDHT